MTEAAEAELPSVTVTSVTTGGREIPVLNSVEMSEGTKQLRDELKAVIQKHGDEDPRVKLAVTAHVLGTILPSLDPKAISLDRAKAMVDLNITAGQNAAMREIMPPPPPPGPEALRVMGIPTERTLKRDEAEDTQTA